MDGWMDGEGGRLRALKTYHVGECCIETTQDLVQRNPCYFTFIL